MRPEDPQVLGGNTDLEVVGESHYQDNLRRITGPGRVRIAVTAVLIPETENLYDPNAISVWATELPVGYLSREDAVTYRSGLIALTARYGRPIGLQGVAVGEEMIGVFLRHDPRDFGIEVQPLPNPHKGSIRTGLSEALATDDADDSYDLRWLATVPFDPAAAIARLRELLVEERDPLDRHFMFHELEAALYRARNALPDALRDFDDVCAAHDREMETLRQAFLAKWNVVPWLQTYRQMCVRKQKQGDWTGALWWAERGLAVYGEMAARPDAVADLEARAEAARVQLARPSEVARTARAARTSGPAAQVMIETLTCASCLESFDRPRTRGRKPTQCPKCRHRDGAEAPADTT